MSDENLKSSIRAELFPPAKSSPSGGKVVDHADLEIVAVMETLDQEFGLNPSHSVMQTLDRISDKLGRVRAMVDAKNWNEF